MATPVGAAAAGYLRMVNFGGRGDRLVGASSPWARQVEIHQTVVTRGATSERLLPGGVWIGAHRTLDFSPNGYRIVLKGLRRPLRPGDRVPASVRFLHAGRIAFHFYIGEAEIRYLHPGPAVTTR